jgi:hypothetical protein
MNESILSEYIIGSYKSNEGNPENLYNGFEIDWDKVGGRMSGERVHAFLNEELERFIAFNPTLQNHKRLFCNYLKLRVKSKNHWEAIGLSFNSRFGSFLNLGVFGFDVESWNRIGVEILNYCEQATKPQQSEPEVEPTSKQIEKLRYLHLSGLLPHLIEQHKRISGQTSVNWDSIAHVVSKMIGEPALSIRKPIREHYTSHNDRLEGFKSKEEVLGFLKSKKVRE